MAIKHEVIGKYSRDYPRVSPVEGDEKRYAHLESPEGDNLFAAYEPQEMKLGKILIVASADYLYTPARSFGQMWSSS